MIDIFYYSIANKKTNQTIDDLLSSMLSLTYLPSQDKKIIKHIQEVAENGSYPSKEYFNTFYKQPEFVYSSLAEIVTLSKKVIDNFHKQNIEQNLIKAINESGTSQQLLNRISSLSEETPLETEFSDVDCRPILYSDNQGKPETKGITTGVSEIDSLTNGFQQGTIASVCGFVGHGKSTFTVSIIFKNLKEGKKCCLLSLEMAPELIWMQFQARYLYEVKGIQVTSQDLIMHKLTKEMEEKIKEYDDDFRKEICDNLLILDESYLSKTTLLNYKNLNKLFRFIDSKLNGVDFIAWDHVGQLELLFPDCGNQIIKQIQSSSKTFINCKGNKIVNLFAVQTNREGNKRANRRGGVYDLQAISDLNEVERSSTYVLFIYTSDDMKVVQETKIDLKKHRLGSVLSEPITTTFNPAVSIVGTTVDKIEIDDDFMSSLGDLDFDDFS